MRDLSGPAPQLRCGPGPAAPDLADGEREGVGRVGGLRGLGEAQQPGDHGADLGLVGATAARDGSLDLARGVQGDRDARAGRRPRWRRRTPAPCPSRCARCAGLKTRSTATASGWWRSSHRSSSPRGRRGGGRRRHPETCGRARPRPVQRTAGHRRRRRPSPQRVRPGSTPSTRTSSPPASRRTRVRHGSRLPRRHQRDAPNLGRRKRATRGRTSRASTSRAAIPIRGSSVARR